MVKNALILLLLFSGVADVISQGYNPWEIATPDIFDTAPAIVVNTTTAGTDVLNKDYTLPAGKYQIALSFHVNCDIVTSDAVVTATFDGANLSSVKDEIFRSEFKDSATGGGEIPGTGSSQIWNYAHNFIVDITTGGAKNLTIRVESEAGGVESSVWDLTVIFKRIG